MTVRAVKATWVTGCVAGAGTDYFHSAGHSALVLSTDKMDIFKDMVEILIIKQF